MDTKNVHRFYLVYAVLVLDLLLFGNFSAQGRFQNRDFSVQASLSEEAKAYMTTSQEKIGSDLLQLIDQRFLPQGTSLQSHAETMKNLKQLRSKQATGFSAESVKEAEVYVYIHLAPDGQTETVTPLVSNITDIDESNHLVVAWVKVKNLDSLASLNAVKTVRSVVPPINTTGSVTTEGDVIHRTADVRSTYSQAGSGIKVGIISSGVDHRSSAQSTNDLPPDGSGLTVRSNAVGGDEGTAMLEIVYDMVPSADLYFHDQGTNVVAFDNAIDDLVSVGCKVICDDVGWITQPFFEDGTVASHVASVLSGHDIVYVSSAGNAGDTHYQGDYYPITSSTQHDFSHGSSSTPYLYIHMSSGANVRVVLQWNDQFGSSGNDYDLSLIRISSGLTVAMSSNRQNGNDDPLETFSYAASAAGDYAIVVNKYSGSARTLEVYIYPGSGDMPIRTT
jgi:hypothetical protein